MVVNQRSGFESVLSGRSSSISPRVYRHTTRIIPRFPCRSGDRTTPKLTPRSRESPRFHIRRLWNDSTGNTPLRATRVCFGKSFLIGVVRRVPDYPKLISHRRFLCFICINWTHVGVWFRRICRNRPSAASCVRSGSSTRNGG